MAFNLQIPSFIAAFLRVRRWVVHYASMQFRHLLYKQQGWQYGTVRSEFAFYVPRILNRTVPAYRTSVQFLKRTAPTYRTRTNRKKAYRTSVPYFLAKIEAYRNVLPSFL